MGIGIQCRMWLLGLSLLLFSAPLHAQAPAEGAPPEPTSMAELLDLVRTGFEVERLENKQREEEFVRRRADQESLLAEAEADLARQEERSQRLEEDYNENEQQIGVREEQLTERLGQLGELFGVVRQVSTDTSGQIWDSLTSSQLGPRRDLLERLGRSKELPSTADLEALWFELQREMVEQGKVVRYPAKVLTINGDIEEREVIRVGPFAAISNGRYLLWETQDQHLRELTRQPPSRYLSTVARFESAKSGFADLAVDPSRGALLNALTDTPGVTERINQGGYVGYVIISLGIFAVIIGLFRWIVIAVVGRKVAFQRKRDKPSLGNPLGRVLNIYEENRDLDPEVLELKIDEVVMKESAKLTRLLWLIKVVSVVSPLLGLLGTVTGMIQTFQAITLFGAGDPKMMAGGISEALVTTMLGLTVAIPLVLLHAVLANNTKRIIETLDEQSAGLIATRAEQASV
ncbi:MAG: MotA/TolQ/ExbB proton channel family protein [Deltaproteobacteria bacterium]|nr:MotA/TolQ/ExbB proton channel family protein [Deltaproteobacteria bacterium]MBW2418278.1 MotA/TolQ/ExbB proton channel family protein [Deltaproteobacteria bacterium]